jgi:hypothetical protein
MGTFMVFAPLRSDKVVAGPDNSNSIIRSFEPPQIDDGLGRNTECICALIISLLRRFKTESNFSTLDQADIGISNCFIYPPPNSRNRYRNFIFASWNAGLILINPRILNDMIIAQEGCQLDRQYFGGLRVRMIAGKQQQSIISTLPF